MNKWLFLLLLQTATLSAQTPRPNKYWVTFSDKNNSPYCLCRPAELLSARALERRAKASIPLDETDLPVNPEYVEGLKAKGARIHLTSRWLNAAAVIADSLTATRLKALAYVDTVQYVGPHLRTINHVVASFSRDQRPPVVLPKPLRPDNPYGYSGMQNSLLNLPLLHFAGHRGHGIWVGVMDGGFLAADILPFFDSVANDGRLMAVRNFVDRYQNVYLAATHGTSVLSAMAANVPGYLVGGAPDAAYFLFRTEDTSGEFPIEECNWVAAAEYADSMGIDIINASLGYTSFNDAALSHSFEVLNGRTAIGSRGASIAVQKGMIVCNSAGNSGDEPWKHIGVPADAPGVIAVGALDYDGTRASFSSFGPTADGRIKPDLCAPGLQVVVAGSKDFELGMSSGTSLASPMLTGGIAALWSAFPDKTAAEIVDAVYASADQYDRPDVARGYGLPDLSKAWGTLAGFVHDGDFINNARNGFFASDPRAGTLTFWSMAPLSEPSAVYLKNILGESIPVAFRHHLQRVGRIELEGLSDLPAGTYTLSCVTQGGVIPFLGLVWH
jgi:hypothetical protein